jgi:hypothetical protein
MDNIGFIKTDDDYYVNIKSIRWVKEMDECMRISVKSNGRQSSVLFEICKKNNPLAYNKLVNKLNT